MRRLRLAAALLAVGLAASANTAVASTACPWGVVVPGKGTCAYTGRGASCEACEFECDDGLYWWNVCKPGGGENDQ